MVALFEATYPPACFIPDGHKTVVRMGQADTSSPDGRFRFRLPGYRPVPDMIHDLKTKYHENRGK